MPFPTKAAFRQFLREHLDKPIGLPGMANECPLARCLMAQGYQRVHVGFGESWWYTVVAPNVAGGVAIYKERKTPKWAERFMTEFDTCAQPRSVSPNYYLQVYTGREALKFLR